MLPLDVKFSLLHSARLEIYAVCADATTGQAAAVAARWASYSAKVGNLGGVLIKRTPLLKKGKAVCGLVCSSQAAIHFAECVLSDEERRSRQYFRRTGKADEKPAVCACVSPGSCADSVKP